MLQGISRHGTLHPNRIETTSIGKEFRQEIHFPEWAMQYLDLQNLNVNAQLCTIKTQNIVSYNLACHNSKQESRASW